MIVLFCSFKNSPELLLLSKMQSEEFAGKAIQLLRLKSRSLLHQMPVTR
jgi:hypothetical protein